MNALGVWASKSTKMITNIVKWGNITKSFHSVESDFAYVPAA